MTVTALGPLSWKAEANGRLPIGGRGPGARRAANRPQGAGAPPAAAGPGMRAIQNFSGYRMCMAPGFLQAEAAGGQVAIWPTKRPGKRPRSRPSSISVVGGRDETSQ